MTTKPKPAPTVHRAYNGPAQLGRATLVAAILSLVQLALLIAAIWHRCG